MHAEKPMVIFPEAIGHKSSELFKWPNDITPPVYFANTQWAVTKFGLESLTWEYAIERKRLAELDWVEHVCSKTWADVHSFCEAYEVALIFHRIRGRSAIIEAMPRGRHVALQRKETGSRFSQFCRSMGISPEVGVNADDLWAAYELFDEKQR